MKKKDIVLLVTLLLIAVVLLTVGWTVKRMFAGDKEDMYVCIYREGKQTDKYPLNEDKTLQLGSGAEGFNSLVIEGGSAYISEADCPGHDCINMGSIDESGEEIICLPHKLVIRIEGGKPSVDATVR